MTVGDGLNKRAPVQSEWIEVLVEVIESVVKSGLVFQFAERCFACLAQCRGETATDTHASMLDSRIQLLLHFCLLGKSNVRVREFLGNFKGKNIFQLNPNALLSFSAIIVLTSPH